MLVINAIFITQCEHPNESINTTMTKRDSDADFELVMSAYDASNELIRESGWDGVKDEQRHLANVMAFYGKIENGGFGGFYFDSEYLPDMMEELSASLKLVGANRAEELMRVSTQKFDGGIVPEGLDGRVAVARTYPEGFDPFEDLDTQFYVEAEEYIPLLADYVRANPEVFMGD